MTVHEETNPLNDKPINITKIARTDRYNVNYFHLLCYAFSSLAFSMILSTFNFYSTKYLLDTAKLSPLLTSIITFLSRMFDGITDAIYAYFINKSKKTKYGKMTPW
jgi:Na+/melibiose symporter-like transporter